MRALQSLTTLKSIELLCLDLAEPVNLKHMSKLDTLVLQKVNNANFTLQSLCCQLKCVELKGINLTDTVNLENLSQLEIVVLQNVQRAEFILPSLCLCRQLKHVEIEDIYLDDDVRLTVRPLTKTTCEQLIRVGWSTVHWLWRYDEVAKEEDRAKFKWLKECTIRSKFSWQGNVDDVTLVGVDLQNVTDPNHFRVGETDLQATRLLLHGPHRMQLQAMELDKVQMSPRMWAEFVNSLLNERHTVHVELKRTNIDDETLFTIHNSPHFIVTEETLSRSGIFWASRFNGLQYVDWRRITDDGSLSETCEWSVFVNLIQF